MDFWQSAVLWQLVWIAALLAVTDAGLRKSAVLSRLAIPRSLIAGTLGLFLGPAVLGVLPLERAVLESGVYHGLGLLFITVGLGASGHKAIGRGVRSWSRAMPMVAVVQLTVGAVVCGLSGLLGHAVNHAGWGIMLTLGFMQGPGQALVLGRAWESTGMLDGAQVGLVFAAAGFFWSILLGVPMVLWGQHRGWARVGAPSDRRASDTPLREAPHDDGSIEPLSRVVATIGALYGATYFLISSLVAIVPGADSMSATLWGFHFLFGLAVAMLYGRVTGPLPEAAVRDVGRMSGMTVDFMTCAALAAVQPGVLQANFWLVMTLTFLGAVATLWWSLWVSCRAFDEEPFEHAVLLFGTATGTLPTGMALLRMLDPTLQGPSSRDAVVGAGGTLMMGLPGLMMLAPVFSRFWPDTFVLLAMLPALCLYAAGLMGWWAWRGELKVGDPRVVWRDR